MEVEIKFVETDHIIKNGVDPTFAGTEDNFVAIQGTLIYQSLPNFHQNYELDVSFVIGDDIYSNYIRTEWKKIHNPARHIPCGEVRLRNYIPVYEAGLCVNVGSRVAVIGSTVNWGVDFAKWYIQQIAKRESRIKFSNSECFLIDSAHSISENNRECFLMDSPGSSIYGHWILDYVPRLYMLQFLDKTAAVPLIFSRIPTWASVFLQAFGIENSRIIIRNEAVFTCYSNLRMPSATKNGFAMSQPFNREAWRYFSTFVKQHSMRIVNVHNLPQCDKIFLSRRKFGSTRYISNIRKIEEMAADRGYKIIEPEQFDIFHQAEILKRSRIVIGEDGSALHNIIFSEPGARLGVIAVPDRPNLWHVSLCQSFNHELYYIVAKMNENQEKEVDVIEFAEFLDTIER